MPNNPEYPTQLLEIPPADAIHINRLLCGTLEPESFESVETHLHQCWHRPSRVSLVLLACNEILEGHGIEPIYGHDHWDVYHGNVEASYVNMGDLYLPTVIRDHRWDDWRVTSIDQFMEQHEGRFR
ncbi:hypothetical protein [Acanthopleuribacter pedis]|uniref:Uncharacterized protein n=1 Tax=Acanthopleuribacter pedis TaxID=442870 RepID=A0A8J7QGM9_9BACT|nr:hypothetical protein [Acanthopleuribacter pedis]MBO1318308.1 hypothetical protein [Acanthopleuribacter pedis]